MPRRTQTRSSIWRKPDGRTGREWGSLVRWLLSFLAVVGTAGVLPLSAPGTAHACSCAFAQDGPLVVEHVSRASAAFTGTPTTERIDGYTAYYEFDVREVFGGDVGATTVVSSSTQSAACGRGFNLGTEYLVFTSRHETRNAPWSVEACSATTESTNTRTRDATISVYGQPRQPDPQARSVGVDDVRAPRWPKLVAVTAVVVVAAALVRLGSVRPRRS